MINDWHKFLLTMLAVISGSFFLSACMDMSQYAPKTPVIENVEQKYDTYTVRHGDTLQEIAKKFAVTKGDLLKSNNLSLEPTLQVGQKLKVPAPHVALSKHSLLWPTRGKVVRVFSRTNVGSKGIDIAGGLGQDIRASGDGRVVYSGTSLSGFGNLIIVKHNDRVVTVYALNRKILVREGQTVRAGEKIGEMGSNKQGDVLMHFEVRIDGKPQNPLLYLLEGPFASSIFQLLAQSG